MRPSSPVSNDRQAYIPRQVEQAMNKHLQQSLPSHLKQYVGPNKPAYIPQRIERELNQQMQKSMPGHLKQYAGAYMQQNVIQPTARPVSSGSLAPRPPIPNPRKLDHSIPVGEQHNALWADLSNPTTVPSPASMSFQGQQNQNGQQPVYGQAPPAGNGAGPTNHNPYDFIVNPTPPKRASLFGGNNFKGQIIAVLGIAVVLMIVLAVGASLLKPKSSTTGLIALAERQQEIVRVATAGVDQAVSQSTKDFTVNTEASITSSQAQLVAYLEQHGTKLSDKQLALDQSTETDTLLADATTTNTYDTALVQNLSDQLKTYEGLLQTTFKQTSNPETKQLLQDEFSSANLLLEQAAAVHP